jgi:acetyltransferase-like isoleucine patch superfamily enzyme
LAILGKLFWRFKARVEAAHYGRRRAGFIVRARMHALWRHAAIDLTLAPDLKLGKDVRMTLVPRTRNVIRVGPHCTIGERALFVLDGGEIELADWVEIRRDVVLRVAGRLSFGGRNLISQGVSLHCDEAVTVGPLAVITEHVTIVDSAHYFTTPDDWMLDNLKTGPIEIGYNAWIGAKATIGRNVTLGDHVVVAANSLVVDDVPAGHLASGVPAAIVRRIVPWASSADDEVGGQVSS